MNAMRRYKEDYEATKDQLTDSKKKLESARVAALTKQMELDKIKEQASEIDNEIKRLKRESTPSKLVKKAENEYANDIDGESANGRVSDAITAIHNAAEKRRSIVNEKKTNGSMCAEWGAKVDGVDIDASTKKSIWQKMQRKRINTVLRPSHDSLVRNLVKEVKPSPISSSNCFDMGQEDSAVDPSIRAEELLLLSLHPEAPAGSFPPVATLEPGWRVCLDTPPEPNPRSILPVDRSGLLSQSFLTVCCSTGRQAASFLEPHHLRSLDTDAPLAFATKACSLAESKIQHHDNATPETLHADPLSEPDNQLQLGYNFVLREPKKTDANSKAKAPAKKAKAKSKTPKEPKESKEEKEAKSKPSTTAKAKPTAKNKKAEKPQKSKASKEEPDATPKEKSIAAKGSNKSRKRKTDPSQTQQQAPQQPFPTHALNNALSETQQTQLDMQFNEKMRMLEANKQVAMNQHSIQAKTTSQQSALLQSQQQPNLQQHNFQQQPNLQQQCLQQQNQQSLQQQSLQQQQQKQQQQQQQPNFQQFQNLFSQNQLIQGPGAMPMNNNNQQQMPGSSQQQLLMLKHIQQQQQQIQQQQQHNQQRLQDQIQQQNHQQMSFNYLQAQQQRLALSQPQMAQLMQQNMMGNNAQMLNPQQQQQQGLDQSGFQKTGKPGDKK